VYAQADPHQSHDREKRALHSGLRLARGALGWLLATLAIAAGVGWLYLLRDAQFLNAGPRVGGALPLEELASRGAQPLLRMAVAWLPAGFAVGFALALGTRLRAAWVGVSCAALSFVILGLTTAASEAVSRNETFVAHLRPALLRSGLWTAVGLAVIGSLLAAVVGGARPRRRASAATGASERVGSAVA
jgi:hypothetical protein